MKNLCLLVIAICISGINAENATVKLLTHNLESLGTFTNIAIGALSITGEGGKHWAIVVQFDDDDLVYLCELHRNETQVTAKGSGGIIGECNYITKEEAIENKKGVRIYNFGIIDTTPEELIQMANDISYNGQEYHLFLRNCQHWAKELLEKLGMSTAGFNIRRFLERSTGPGWLISRFENNFLE